MSTKTPGSAKPSGSAKTGGGAKTSGNATPTGGSGPQDTTNARRAGGRRGNAGQGGPGPQEPAPASAWPELPLDAWSETCDTLHMWTQIVGKVKLELCPFLHEWWEVALHLSARGLTTNTIPWRDGAFAIDFDFLEHNLYIRASDGAVKALALMPRTVADFYREFMAALGTLGIEVTINTMPQEVERPIPFERDTTHAAYDPEFVSRWWRIMLRCAQVFERYRSTFSGKSSPVQFFWGSFDLNETRYSGKPAQPPKGGGRIMRFAEDQQNASAGFWPGNGKLGRPAFYAYAYPEPEGYAKAAIRPDAAHYDTALGEFILLYDDMRAADDPERSLTAFLRSTYEAGARLGGWDLQALEQRAPTGAPTGAR